MIASMTTYAEIMGDARPWQGCWTHLPYTMTWSRPVTGSLMRRKNPPRLVSHEIMTEIGHYVFKHMKHDVWNALVPDMTEADERCESIEPVLQPWSLALDNAERDAIHEIRMRQLMDGGRSTRTTLASERRRGMNAAHRARPSSHSPPNREADRWHG